MSKNNGNGGNNYGGNGGNHGGHGGNGGNRNHNNGGNHGGNGGNRNGGGNRKNPPYDQAALDALIAASNAVAKTTTPKNFNIVGRESTDSGFNLTLDEFEKDIAKIANLLISDVCMVTSYIDLVNGVVGFWVWFDRNGKHFTQTVQSGNSVYNHKTYNRNSREFDDFVKLFGYVPSDDNPSASSQLNYSKIISENSIDESARLKGVRISTLAFMGFGYDSSGVIYGNVNKETPRKHQVIVKPVFEEDKYTKENRSLLYMRLVKMAKSTFITEKPVPRNHGRF